MRDVMLDALIVYVENAGQFRVPRSTAVMGGALSKGDSGRQQARPSGRGERSDMRTTRKCRGCDASGTSFGTHAHRGVDGMDGD